MPDMVRYIRRPSEVHCLPCFDDGMVCENHPQFPWGITVEGHNEDCGGAGMPCPACCSPIPEDGRHAIAEAFVPDWKRAPAGGMPRRPPQGQA